LDPVADPVGELEWTPPGDGVWWLTREHMPRPVSRLMFALLPAATEGWARGAARLGLPQGRARWGRVHGWVYYSPGEADPATYDDLERAAAETLATHRWRGDARDWFERRRAEVVAADLALQAVDPGSLDDEALADHIAEAVAHFRDVARIHFEHSLLYLTLGWLADAADRWELDPGRVLAALQGASTASTAAQAHLVEIAAALAAAGTGPEQVGSVDDIRAAGPTAAAALDRYLDEFGWRLLDGNELAEAALVEQPAVLVASIRTVLGRTGAPDEPSTPDAIAELRAAVPADERDRFDELLDDARRSYRLGDDDGAICWTWPLGLIRRGVLEAGRRLRERGAVHAVDDLFEASLDELDALVRGRSSPSMPDRDALAARSSHRARVAGIEPPVQLGELTPPDPGPTPLPPAVAELAAAQQAYFAFARGADASPPMGGDLRGTGVGTGRARGRAFVLRDVADLADIEPGDILVTMSTTSSLNGVFPILAGVVTETGGPLSHAAVLARELGLPAVVGVTGALGAIRTGAELDVDAAAGAVHVR
jgi:pyruvate,water dikinase